jgi:biopolymer transport protein ExbB
MHASRSFFVPLLRLAALALVMWAAAWTLPAAAQGPDNGEPEVTAAEEADAVPAEKGKTLLITLKEGGILMIPIFACSFLMLVFVFERAISLRRARVIPAPFVKRFMHQLREGKLDRDGALEMCESSRSVISDVLTAAVKKWGRPEVEVEQAFLDAGERAANSLRRYLRLFSTISTLSPLLGLLGTVFGMIRIFEQVSLSDAMGKAEMLAGGISEAMLTTAGGLCVAAPSLVFYSYFSSRVDKLIMQIDAVGQEMAPLISAEALAEARGARARRGTAA